MGPNPKTEEVSMNQLRHFIKDTHSKNLELVKCKKCKCLTDDLFPGGVCEDCHETKLSNYRSGDNQP
jgi:hypothetical protein